MSDKSKNSRTASGDYEIGYGKPHKEKQFKKGQSGNPMGKRRGAKNRKSNAPEKRLAYIIPKEAYRSVEMREGERVLSFSVAEAVVRSIAVNAAKGQARAQKQFTELLQDVEERRRQEQDAFLSALIEYKRDWEDELEDRRITGHSGHVPLPHPDDIHINL